MEDLQKFVARVEQLREEGGMAPGAEFEQAQLEGAVERWPSEWGNAFQFVLRGAVNLKEDLTYGPLGISIESKPIEGEPCAYKGTVTVPSRDWPGLADGIRRLELFFNALNLVAWGRAITYSTGFTPRGALALTNVEDHLNGVGWFMAAYSRLSPKQQNIVARASWWLRQCQGAGMSDNRDPSVFGMFMAYWNAFECLVEVVCIAKPLPQLGKAEKKEAIADFFRNLGHDPSAEDVTKCFNSLVNPGFRAKAEHVFKVVYGPIAEQKMAQCFGSNGLYRLRNDIDHGNIAEYIDKDRLRVQGGMNKIWQVVYGLFHIVMELGIIEDPSLQVCYTCEHLTADKKCKLDKMPEAEWYWRFKCSDYSRIPGKAQ